MKLMALGEIGAFLLGVATAVWFAIEFSEASVLTRVGGAAALLYIATSVGLRFIHLGYVPDKKR